MILERHFATDPIFVEQYMLHWSLFYFTMFDTFENVILLNILLKAGLNEKKDEDPKKHVL